MQYGSIVSQTGGGSAHPVHVVSHHQPMSLHTGCEKQSGVEGGHSGGGSMQVPGSQYTWQVQPSIGSQYGAAKQPGIPGS
jgi:hypothetical protein